MDRTNVPWRGYWPAAPTPFTRSGKLDEATFRSVLRLYLRQGMHGVVINGSSGEWYSQTISERKRLATIATQELGRKTPVVIGCTTYTAADTIALARHAASVGADGIMTSIPPYLRLYPNEIVAFFETVSGGIELPILIYNWPPGTGVDIDTHLMRRLVEIQKVVAIKDSTPDLDQLHRTLRAVVGIVRVFGNFLNDRGVEALREVGGDGYIGGGSLFGADDPEFFNAIWRGDYDRALVQARRWQKLYDLTRNPDWSGKYGPSQSMLKAIMKIQGVDAGYPRPPRLPIEDEDNLEGLRHALEEVDALTQPLVA